MIGLTVGSNPTSSALTRPPLLFFPTPQNRNTTHLRLSPLTNPKSQTLRLRTTTLVAFAGQNDSDSDSDKELKKDREEEEAGVESDGGDEKGKGKGKGGWRWGVEGIRWSDLVVSSDPDNIVAVGLTGLLTWASVQVLWQLVFISLAILVAAVKYSLIAAFLIFILITLL